MRSFDTCEWIPTENGLLASITDHHARFLSFLAARVENIATAEDIFQSASIKAIKHGSEI